jgi:hypothetical protein
MKCFEKYGISNALMLLKVMYHLKKVGSPVTLVTVNMILVMILGVL